MAAQTMPCGPEELKESLPTDAPAYPDAMALSETLNKHGVTVKCVLSSKMDHVFEGQEGAALYRTKPCTERRQEPNVRRE